MIRLLIILWISIKLIISIIGITSLINKQNNPDFATIVALTDQLQKLERDLDKIEENNVNQPLIRNDLLKTKADLESLRGRYEKDSKFDWWAHGINPLLMIIFLIYFIKNKNFLAEQAAPSNP